MRVPPPGMGPGRRQIPHAGELFTDRNSESQAFKNALAEFRKRLDRDDEIGIARHNVLTFYGLGGIGKTALSARLEAWVSDDLPLDNGWGPPPVTRVAATARIDLHESAGQVNTTATLLALRAGVASLRRRWPLFDLAFTAYWSATQPGQPLPNIGGRDELNSTVADTVKDLIGDLGSAADLALGAGAGLAVKGVRKLVGEIRRRRDIAAGITAYPGYGSFLLRCADEPSPTDPHPSLACEIAAVLAWEIASMAPAPLVLVFIDTTERLRMDPRRVAEGHLNALVHGMPNVLFVLSGRDMLDWHDDTRVQLTHRGPWTWPGLIPGSTEEPRQHLIGNLSPDDTRTVIRRGARQLDITINRAVVEELAKASGGLPQYLELARQVATSIKDSGTNRQVQVADVTGSLDSMVMRVLDDVPPDEQRAIRAACLFRTFDTHLMAAAADVDHGCAERAVQRPMIDRFEGERYPYRMHDTVREAIRRTDHRVAGGWAERDWELAASRAASAARGIHDLAKEREDNRGVLEAVAIAIALVCEQNVTLEPSRSPNYEDWLAQAIVFSPSIQDLYGRIPAQSRTYYGQLVLDFVAAKSLETPVDERLTLLRRVYDSTHPLRFPAARHLGYTLKDQHRWDEALAVFDELARLRPIPLHLGQRPQLLSTARRYADARDAAAGLPAEALIRRVAEYQHGRPERFFSEIRDKIASLRRQGRQRELIEDEGCLLERRTLLTPDVTAAEVANFLGRAEITGHNVAIRSALLVAILHGGMTRSGTELALDRLHALDKQSGIVGVIGFRFALAELADALVVGSRARLEALHTEISVLAFRTRSWIPIECFLESVDLPLPPMPTQWLEPREQVVQRWTNHLDRYLTRRGASR